MGSEYPDAIDMFVDRNRVFDNANPHDAIVIHKTASGGTAESQAEYFAVNPEMKSTHFIIGQDGHVVQCVSLLDGAAGNCCLENGHDPYWDRFNGENLNWFTVSIEHVDPTPDNSTPLTDGQKQASFNLVKWLVVRLGTNVIKGHNTIDHISRARCPGNYPWQELFDFLKGGYMDYREQQMQDVWNSCSQYLWAHVPRYDTGIAIQWQVDYRHGNQHGPPLGDEIQTVDWSGRKIARQEFPAGWYEWDVENNGPARFYHR